MRRVVRPVMAVLLLVGVGVAATDLGSARCRGPICALIIADDDDARVGQLAVVVPELPRLQTPDRCDLAAPAQPTVALRTADLLVDAPKTSPPA